MIVLPDRWILDRYIRLLRRVLHAARAHARHSYQSVIHRLTECIVVDRPDSYLATEADIQSYLDAVGRAIVETRYACNDAFGSDGHPYKLIPGNQFGEATVLSPGCDAAMSLLDVVDDNVCHMLISWGQDFWCPPKDLYDRLRQHEVDYESGLARFTGFLHPVEALAPASWACDS